MPTARTQGGEHDKAQPIIRAASSGELKVSRRHPVSPDVVINLINLMVENKMIKQSQADALIKQAQDEAYVSRQATKEAAMKAAQATREADAAAAAVTPPGTRRVVYVPEIVKHQLREEIKREVLRTAQREAWASPCVIRNGHPGFDSAAISACAKKAFSIRRGMHLDSFSRTSMRSTPARHTIFQQGIWFSIRTSIPTRIAMRRASRPVWRWTPTFSTASRQDFASPAVAISQPVSTNQTFGGSGANFSKSADGSTCLSVTITQVAQPPGDLNISLGRFANPFFSATDLVWYHDLGFDGAALQARRHIQDTAFTLFIVACVAPTFNTDLNFGTTNDVKYGSQDRYLLGGQIGTAWAINPHINALFGVAYYDFTNIQGRLSTPCNVLSTATVCSTDDLRPSFAQNGNTYMTLRNIIPTQGTGSNMNDTVNQFQYFGLASAFREVDVSGRVDFGYFHPINIVLDGEFVDNTAFNKAAVGAVAVNNIGGLLSSTSPGTYAGGNIGWMTRLTVGHEELRQFGDWNVNVGYKYLQSDAVVDAFADADFGLGGTNLKGYLLGANLAITPSVWTSLRWLSADSIAGPPFAVDVLMLDLNAKY